MALVQINSGLIFYGFFKVTTWPVCTQEPLAFLICVKQSGVTQVKSAGPINHRTCAQTSTRWPPTRRRLPGCYWIITFCAISGAFLGNSSVNTPLL